MYFENFQQRTYKELPMWNFSCNVFVFFFSRSCFWVNLSYASGIFTCRIFFRLVSRAKNIFTGFCFFHVARMTNAKTTNYHEILKSRQTLVKSPGGFELWPVLWEKKNKRMETCKVCIVQLTKFITTRIDVGRRKPRVLRELKRRFSFQSWEYVVWLYANNTNRWEKQKGWINIRRHKAL